MPAPTQTQELNPLWRIKFEGVDDSGNEISRPVLIRRDRALVIWNRLVAFNGTREQVVRSDDQNLLRSRPYEPIYPVSPALMPGSLTLYFTATAARVRLWFDITNTLGASATCRIQHVVATPSGSFDWLPNGTPCPTGFPMRPGFKDLAPGDAIWISSSPANSCTAHGFIDRYNPTGDTP